MPGEVVLANARFLDGTIADVHVADGVVAASASGDADTVDLGERLLLPAMAEPHAHLDKAFTADLLTNPSGDLPGAIEVMTARWPAVEELDIEERAMRGARRLLASGTTAIRTHADLTPESGRKSVRALVAVRDRLASLLDIQVVALTSFLTGPTGAQGRALLSQGIASGVDVVGSCPHVEPDPIEAIDLTLTAAAEAGLPADLHFDEVLDVDVQHLLQLAASADRHGMGGRVTASHCVSHGLLSPVDQREVARALADTGVAVITNPRTNLFLQGRGVEQAPPRGLAGVTALLEEGVAVAAGADNVQDPFYPIGRSDPLETAALLVGVAHRSIEEAWNLIADQARLVMGVPRPGFAAGDIADFLAIRADSLRHAVADQSADRLVIRRGRLVARTSVVGWIADA